MYGLFTYIYPTNQLNVDRYTIHGNSGDYPIIIKNNIQLYIYMYPDVILVDDQRIEGGVGFASQHRTNDSKVPVQRYMRICDGSC